MASPELRRGDPEVAKPSEVQPNPMQYSSLPATSHTYEMVDGVMRVYADDTSEENIFPVSVTHTHTHTHTHTGDGFPSSHVGRCTDGMSWWVERR